MATPTPALVTHYLVNDPGTPGVQGEAYVKIWIIEVEGLVLVNNKYVAGCAGVNGFGV